MSIKTGTSFRFLRQTINGDHDLENDTLFVALFSTLANIDPQTVDDFSSISGELVGTGYTTGGEQMTQSVIYTPGGEDRPSIDFDDVVWGPGATWGITNEAAQGAVIYNTTAGPQQDKVIWVINFGSPESVNNGTFTIVWPDPTDPTLAAVRTSG